MKIAILSRNPRLYSTRRLVEAAVERGHEAQVIDVLRCYMNITSHRPGSRQVVELQLPLLYTHTPVVMTAQVIRGHRGGPCIFVSAAVHGD
jgi:glutathione synthase/RimK-type ligase-like ATP-grasp enzyme